MIIVWSNIHFFQDDQNQKIIEQNSNLHEEQPYLHVTILHQAYVTAITGESDIAIG